MFFCFFFFKVCLASAWQNRRNSVCMCSGRPEGASKYVQSTFCWNRHQRSAAFLSHQPLTHICVRQKKEQVTWSSTVKERIGRWGPTNAPRHCDPLMWLFEIIFDGSFLLGVFRFDHLEASMALRISWIFPWTMDLCPCCNYILTVTLLLLQTFLNFSFWLFFQKVLSQNALVPP